jgi:hypothetical protein
VTKPKSPVLRTKVVSTRRDPLDFERAIGPVTAKKGWSNTMIQPFIQGCMSHVNGIGRRSATNFWFRAPPGGSIVFKGLFVNEAVWTLWFTGSLDLNVRDLVLVERRAVRDELAILLVDHDAGRLLHQAGDDLGVRPRWA